MVSRRVCFLKDAREGNLKIGPAGFEPAIAVHDWMYARKCEGWPRDSGRGRAKPFDKLRAVSLPNGATRSCTKNDTVATLPELLPPLPPLFKGGRTTASP